MATTPGGRAAVIVPDGVLFGSAGAERELRRQLLFQHDLDAVISLPAGVFQPYSGVKTSILVFRRFAHHSRETPLGAEPRTRSVWFYSVASDGYSLDQKRDAQPTADCDLWDALAKFPDRVVDSTDYWQPRTVSRQRWRTVTQDVVRLFPDLDREEGQTLSLNERHRELPDDPDEATRLVAAAQAPRVRELFGAWLRSAAPYRNPVDLNKQAARLSTLFTDAMHDLLEGDREGYGRQALKSLVKEARQAAGTGIAVLSADAPAGADAPAPKRRRRAKASAAGADDSQPTLALPGGLSDDQAREAVRSIVLEFAKLDGYDVWVRSGELTRRPNHLPASRSWSVPVRVFAVRPDWTSADGALKGSHDEAGNPRPEFVHDERIYEDRRDNLVKAEFLDPDCIEANGLNLSAGRYQPAAVTAVTHADPAAIIRDLQAIEARIQERLQSLLDKLEAKA